MKERKTEQMKGRRKEEGGGGRKKEKDGRDEGL